MYKIKKWMSTVALLGLIVILGACGAADSDSANTARSDLGLTQYDVMTTVGYTDSKSTEQTTSAANSASSIEQMLIYKGDLNISTDYYDDSYDFIKRSLTTINGYIVSQEDRSGDFANRYTTLQVRIPSEHFFKWVEGIEALPNTKITKHIYTEDVSEEFVDLKAREKAKQVVIDKYIEYMQLATTADELIRYTNELANLQEEVESVQARIRYLSNQVSYSTVTIVLKETKESSFFSELQIGSQLKHAFETGFSGSVSVFAFLISAIIILIPFILFGLCIWAIVYLIIRFYKRKASNRYQVQRPLSNNQPDVLVPIQNNDSNQSDTGNSDKNSESDSNNGEQK